MDNNTEMSNDELAFEDKDSCECEHSDCDDDDCNNDDTGLPDLESSSDNLSSYETDEAELSEAGEDFTHLVAAMAKGLKKKACP